MIRQKFLLVLLLGVLFLPVWQGSAGAQQPPPITATRSGAAVTPVAAGQNRFYAWVMAKQGDYNQRLAQTIREIRTGNPVVATLLLAFLSFAYGILHAAGPGHGKAVISSYVLANEQTVRRGIALSFLASLFQALSALLLFAILIFVFQATGVTRKASEAWLETISWGLVVLLGAGLLIGQLRRLWRQRTAAVVSAHTRGGHDHGHVQHTHGHVHQRHHDQVHALGDAHAHGKAGQHGHGHAIGAAVRDHAQHDHVHAAHRHDHTHGDHSECCGHGHMPDPSQLQGDWSWPKALALAFAVGIRPCTGAIFVLGFALSQGLLWAGIFATFAMALGTAITVSALAALAVGSRELAVRLGGAGDSLWAGRVRTVAGLAGSLAVLGFGLALFFGSLAHQPAF